LIIPMASSDEASTNHPPGFPAPLPTLTLTLSEVGEKITELRLELADRTRRLTLTQAKYDRALTEAARAVNDNAHLRQELETLQRDHARLQQRYNRLLAQHLAGDDSDVGGSSGGQA